MKKPLIAFSIFVLTSLGQIPGQGRGALRDQLVGTWRLVSSTQRLIDGTTRPDPQTGPHGQGYLIYTDTGRVSAVVANPDRPRWQSMQTPTSDDLRTAFAGLVAYCGTFEVNEAGKFVVHHVEVDRMPNASGVDRKRFLAFSGNQLILRAAPPLPQGVTEMTIVWEKVEK